jgi:hypothetical protein
VASPGFIVVPGNGLIAMGQSWCPQAVEALGFKTNGGKVGGGGGSGEQAM